MPTLIHKKLKVFQKTLVLLLFSIAFFLSAQQAFAVLDPWYENAPSCSMERGNLARTGEYKVTPLKKIHGVKWKIYPYGRFAYPGICYNDLLLSTWSAWNLSDGKEIPMSKGSIFYAGILYKNVFYTTELKDHKITYLQGYVANNNKLSLVYNEQVGGNMEERVAVTLIYNDIAYLVGPTFIAAYDLVKKQYLWKGSRPESETSRFSTDGENLYFADWTGHLYAFNLLSGKLVWLKENIISADYVSIYGGKVFATGPEKTPVTSSEKTGPHIYVYALDAKNGKTLWCYSKKEARSGSITVSDNKVLFITYLRTKTKIHYPTHAKLECLNAMTGKLLWRIPIEPIVPNDSIFVAKHFAYIFAQRKVIIVDIRKGKIVSTYTLPNKTGYNWLKWLSPLFLDNLNVLAYAESYDRNIDMSIVSFE